MVNRSATSPMPTHGAPPRNGYGNVPCCIRNRLLLQNSTGKRL
jgi:hypothetical protein